MATKLFTQEMREATKTIHNMSDALVNIKLGVSISNPEVWAEGLMVFYEIFRALEQAMEDHKDSLIGEFDLPGLRRAEAFEADLAFYFGDHWRQTYEIRPEVAQYLAHLKRLEDENPYLLIAYIYHLYMGLLSGGQLLKSKKDFFKSGKTATQDAGDAVTYFKDVSIASLKKRMKEIANTVAKDLDDETRKQILQEGVQVFKLNNTIIKSVRGVNDIFYKRVGICLAILCIILLLIRFIFF
ncbi:hypothetical protein TCAL_02314 [Tigriopus californicus]|uniref:Heme oxygenase n=1 Tax=Tigriopus californicus TaxID=6832 RepID=A0A553NNK5_TIGCA|nr:heme oxygenase 2-like [Tigriopus californicus]TRY67005.1 hypothetical protein TCAL_02314 [Tigriopus californicus]|eukprot:TCALIF_02314-PA protein Name:"Similar to pbsA2 Heme oxygenase 2 (Synechocystis sp. (strain PCC 6803 / Kazusa))" AED:0.00 eAED:0.00 QI:0/-1/0/1/-1/1/1/0/240